jgi:hypothetical protein
MDWREKRPENAELIQRYWIWMKFPAIRNSEIRNCDGLRFQGHVSFSLRENINMSPIPQKNPGAKTPGLYRSD